METAARRALAIPELLERVAAFYVSSDKPWMLAHTPGDKRSARAVCRLWRDVFDEYQVANGLESYSPLGFEHISRILIDRPENYALVKRLSCCAYAKLRDCPLGWTSAVPSIAGFKGLTSLSLCHKHLQHISLAFEAKPFNLPRLSELRLRRLRQPSQQEAASPPLFAAFAGVTLLSVSLFAVDNSWHELVEALAGTVRTLRVDFDFYAEGEEIDVVLRDIRRNFRQLRELRISFFSWQIDIGAILLPSITRLHLDSHPLVIRELLHRLLDPSVLPNLAMLPRLECTYELESADYLILQEDSLEKYVAALARRGTISDLEQSAHRIRDLAKLAQSRAALASLASW